MYCIKFFFFFERDVLHQAAAGVNPLYLAEEDNCESYTLMLTTWCNGPHFGQSCSYSWCKPREVCSLVITSWTHDSWLDGSWLLIVGSIIQSFTVGTKNNNTNQFRCIELQENQHTQTNLINWIASSSSYEQCPHINSNRAWTAKYASRSIISIIFVHRMFTIAFILT